MLTGQRYYLYDVFVVLPGWIKNLNPWTFTCGVVGDLFNVSLQIRQLPDKWKRRRFSGSHELPGVRGDAGRKRHGRSWPFFRSWHKPSTRLFGGGSLWISWGGQSCSQALACLWCRGAYPPAGCLSGCCPILPGKTGCPRICAGSWRGESKSLLLASGWVWPLPLPIIWTIRTPFCLSYPPL